MNITKGELLKLSTNDVNNYIIIVSEVYKNYIICKKTLFNDAIHSTADIL
jgi:hypothetical protein